MPGKQITVINGIILDDNSRLTLEQLSGACAVHIEQVVALVEEGVLEPVGSSPADWHFSAASLARLRTAIRLQQDLQVNPAGVGLALELLEELAQLRARLRSLEMQRKA